MGTGLPRGLPLVDREPSASVRAASALGLLRARRVRGRGEARPGPAERGARPSCSGIGSDPAQLGRRRSCESSASGVQRSNLTSAPRRPPRLTVGRRQDGENAPVPMTLRRARLPTDCLDRAELATLKLPGTLGGLVAASDQRACGPRRAPRSPAAGSRGSPRLLPPSVASE